MFPLYLCEMCGIETRHKHMSDVFTYTQYTGPERTKTVVVPNTEEAIETNIPVGAAPESTRSLIRFHCVNKHRVCDPLEWVDSEGNSLDSIGRVWHNWNYRGALTDYENNKYIDLTGGDD